MPNDNRCIIIYIRNNARRFELQSLYEFMKNQKITVVIENCDMTWLFSSPEPKAHR